MTPCRGFSGDGLNCRTRPAFVIDIGATTAYTCGRHLSWFLRAALTGLALDGVPGAARVGVLSDNLAARRVPIP